MQIVNRFATEDFVMSLLDKTDLDLFYSALVRGKANPNEPLDITTYEGGQNQPTHPKVLFFQNGWNGYKYWMVYTPYPNNDSFEENPCITYSNDGINWSEEGISNPILSIPEEHRGSWYSDTHLVYVPDKDVLELWVRYCSRGTDGLENGWEGVYRLTSYDGINWSDKEYLYHVVDPDWASVLSPSVIYDEGKYKIWFIYQRQCLKYYESIDGTNWQYIKDISTGINPLGNYFVWHFDMIRTEKGYEFVGCYQLNGDFDRNNFIAYSWSEDNENFQPAKCILTNGAPGSFDDLELYRPCLVKIENKYRMYYGAQKNIRIWHIGVVEAPQMETLHALLSNNSSLVLPTYGGTETVNNFDESTWTPGYYNDAGQFIATENNLVMHTSQFIAVDGIPKALSSSASYLRVCYFDENKKFISYDRGNGMNASNSASSGYGINIQPIGAYFVVCANTADKTAVKVSNWTVEKISLDGEIYPSYYLDWTNGKIVRRDDSFSVVYSRYIPVIPGETYYIYAPYRKAATIRCMFHDINKKYNFNGDVSTSNQGTHVISNISQGAPITIPSDSIYYMNFQIGAENVDMTGTTVDDIFVYRKK